VDAYKGCVSQELAALVASSTGVSLLQSLPRKQRVDGTFVALELVRCIPNGASIFTRDFTLWLPLLNHMQDPPMTILRAKPFYEGRA